MELAPALLPPRLNRRSGDAFELLPEARLAGRIGVDRDVRGAFLEPLGMQLEQLRSDLFEQIGGDRDDDSAELASAQRNALFSLSKNPSSLR
jgi:hypothetical protein